MELYGFTIICGTETKNTTNNLLYLLVGLLDNLLDLVK